MLILWKFYGHWLNTENWFHSNHIVRTTTLISSLPKRMLSSSSSVLEVSEHFSFPHAVFKTMTKLQPKCIAIVANTLGRSFSKKKLEIDCSAAFILHHLIFCGTYLYSYLRIKHHPFVMIKSSILSRFLSCTQITILRFTLATASNKYIIF